jgi:hypothetical protein
VLGGNKGATQPTEISRNVRGRKTPESRLNPARPRPTEAGRRFS